MEFLNKHKNEANQQPSTVHQIWIPTVGLVDNEGLNMLLPNQPKTIRIKPKAVKNKPKVVWEGNIDQLTEIYAQEHFRETQEPVKTLTKANQSAVLCRERPNRLGLGKLSSTQRCALCKYFGGIHSSDVGLQRLVCLAPKGFPRLLDFYTSCKAHNRSVKCSKFCTKCIQNFRGIDPITGCVRCEYVKKPKTKLRYILPQKTTKMKFPYPIICPKKDFELVPISTCERCNLFKGFYRNGTFVRVACMHSNAENSQYVQSVASRNQLTNSIKKDKREKKISLAWLFDGVIEKKRPHSIAMQVNCVDKLHFAVELKTNCANNTTLTDCRTKCANYQGIDSNFHVKCRAFASTAIFVNCPFSKTPVKLQTCLESCSQFIRISGDKVKCRFSPIQSYINTGPKAFDPKKPRLRRFGSQSYKPFDRRTKKTHGKLSGKPKFYYDVPDEEVT